MARTKDSDEVKKLKAMANTNPETPGKEKTEDVNFVEVKDETKNPDTFIAPSHEEFKKQITVENTAETKSETTNTTTELPDSLDPSKLSNEIPKTTWNPTEGIPKSADRDYTKIAGGKVIDEVQESFTEPILNPETPPGGPEINAASVKANPELAGASDEERTKAARTMWEMIEKAYRALLGQAPGWVKIGETQIREALVKDEINLKMPYPVYDEKEQLIVVEFKEAITIYNELVDQTLVVDEKFFDEIREPVIREFAKRGIGATDGQKIIFHLIMEGVRVMGGITQLWFTKRSLFREGKLKHAENKKNFAERRSAETVQHSNTQTTENVEQPVTQPTNNNVEEAVVISEENREPEERTEVPVVITHAETEK